jgi:TPR repeat protein
MKHALALLLACCALCGQGTLPAPPADLQPIANPNDERLKVFKELELKAETEDTEAMRALGEYYLYGRFPAVKNEEKAKEAWTKGASLGADQCASMMYNYAYPPGAIDSEVVIERTKWFIIYSVLYRMNRSGGVTTYPSKLSGVSESSFLEAKARAAAFLAGVKVSKLASTPSSPKKLMLPALSFESLSLFDTHRKNVCSAYMKAASPIYNKSEAATDDEKAAFTVAVAELVRLQSYIGRTRRLSLSSNSNEAARARNLAEMNECYAKMSAAKIAATLPATRAELNEASIYINALGKLMQLPVILGRGRAY